MSAEGAEYWDSSGSSRWHLACMLWTSCMPEDGREVAGTLCFYKWSCASGLLPLFCQAVTDTVLGGDNNLSLTRCPLKWQLL